MTFLSINLLHFFHSPCSPPEERDSPLGDDAADAAACPSRGHTCYVESVPGESIKLIGTCKHAPASSTLVAEITTKRCDFWIRDGTWE